MDFIAKFLARKYNALGRIKEETTHVILDAETLFMEKSNQNMLINKIYRLHKLNYGKRPKEYFVKTIPIAMKLWLSKYLIPEYSDVTDVIRVINYDFIMALSNLIREKIKPIGDNKKVWNPFKDPSLRNMTVDKIRNMDLWKPQVTYIRPHRHFRYGNKIPHYQQILHTRNYDRGNEGLRSSKNRSSVEAFNRGYDMSDMIYYADMPDRNDWRKV